MKVISDICTIGLSICSIVLFQAGQLERSAIMALWLIAARIYRVQQNQESR